MASGRAVVTGAAALAIALVATGCSWRVESEPDPFRTPSAVTVLRDHVAAAESALAAAAGSVQGDGAAAEAAAIPVRLAALGGVSPTSSPRPTSDYVAALDAARTEAQACIDGAGLDPLGGLCASILLSHSVISGPPQRPSWEATAFLVGPTTTPGADSEVAADTVANLALAHDRLRALYEVMAARTKGEERARALEDSAEQRSRVEELLAVPGVADLTQPAYDIPADADPLAQQVSIAEAYAALLVAAAPQDREWLLNSAFVSYSSAVAGGLPVGDVPALPGAAQPTPSPSAG